MHKIMALLTALALTATLLVAGAGSASAAPVTHCSPRSEHRTMHFEKSVDQGYIYWDWCRKGDVQWVEPKRAKMTGIWTGSHRSYCGPLRVWGGEWFRIMVYNQRTGAAQRSRWHHAPCERNSHTETEWTLRSWNRIMFRPGQGGTPGYQMEFKSTVNYMVHDPYGTKRGIFNRFPLMG